MKTKERIEKLLLFPIMMIIDLDQKCPKSHKVTGKIDLILNLNQARIYYTMKVRMN